MSLSLYDVSIPIFLRSLGSMATFLDRGRAFADEGGLPHEHFLEARLAPDMLPLTGQVQRASDAAKLAAVRMAQVENLPMADEEKTFADLQARIARTVDFLRNVPADAMDGREQAQIELKTAGGTMNFAGQDYVLHFALPNFLFHVTTAYGILRHKGVPIGKRDFLAG